MPRFKAHYFGGKVDEAMPEPIFHNSFAEAAGVAKDAWLKRHPEGAPEDPKSIRLTNADSGEENVYEFAKVTALPLPAEDDGA